MFAPAHQAAPTGGLCLTFDDYAIDDWHAVMPLLHRYGARTTFFISHFPLLPPPAVDKLRALAAAGHEIGYHTVSHPRASDFLKQRTVEEYLWTEIRPGLQAMRAAGFNPRSFAYPFNDNVPTLDEELRRDFAVLRVRADTLEEALHPPSGNVLLRGKSIDLHSESDAIRRRTVDGLVEDVRAAGRAGKVLVCYAHRISNVTVQHHHINPWGLECLLYAARVAGMRFPTASELA